MSSILDYLVSSTRVMSNLPGHWGNLTRVKYPSNLSEKVGMLGLCWRFVPSKDSNTTMNLKGKV